VAAFLRGVKERGFALGSGYGRLKETTFRIGHMGDHTPTGLDRLLEAMDAALGAVRA